MNTRLAALPLVLAMASCARNEATADVSGDGAAVRIAHLGREGGDPDGLAAIRGSFEARNPGYGLRYHAAAAELPAEEAPRVLFVQRGEGRARVIGAGGEERSSSDCAVGDVLLLRPSESLALAPPLDVLAFAVPEPLPAELPSFVRPDWDPGITDTPGGCATETGAYRRVCLTWLASNGPYVYHALNAHRVRITDSFSHYHPEEGGFDELYLVQMAQPGARVLTSEAVDRIEAPESVTREEARALLETHELEVGDLVYLPRGTMHRGLGGVLAQVITAPGFRPGAEIGLDHHLRAIDERLGLEGEDALPYHAAASEAAVVK